MKLAVKTLDKGSGHAIRGIGSYTRNLIKALGKYTTIEVITSATPYQTSADVVHFPTYDLFFLTLPLLKPLPTLVTIHDVIPLVLSDHYPPGIRGYIKQKIQALSLTDIKHIVTDSECSTKDVIIHLNQPPAKVSTVYLAADERYQPSAAALVAQKKQEFNLDKPYFLYVGDINYNKNIPGLLSAFATFKDRFDLVMVSHSLRRNNPAAAHLWQVIDRLDVGNSLKVMDQVGADDIPTMTALYSGAYGYIQPSFYEGFGLPVIEAQACGAPVISANGGSLAEVVGDSGLLFDPNRPSDLTAALTQVVSWTKEERDHYINQGFINQKRFSWKKTAETMAKLYEILA